MLKYKEKFNEIQLTENKWTWIREILQIIHTPTQEDNNHEKEFVLKNTDHI